MKKAQIAEIKKIIRDFKFRSELHDNPGFKQTAWKRCERLGLTQTAFESLWENINTWENNC